MHDIKIDWDLGSSGTFSQYGGVTLNNTDIRGFRECHTVFCLKKDIQNDWLMHEGPSELLKPESLYPPFKWRPLTDSKLCAFIFKQIKLGELKALADWEDKLQSLYHPKKNT